MNLLPMGVPRSQEVNYDGIQPGLIESLVQDGMVVYGVDSKGIGANVYDVYVCTPSHMADKSAWVRGLDSHEVAALFVALAPIEIAAVPDLIEALRTIAGGHTNRFPGAPDATTWTGAPADFRSAMWAWSQSVAKAALTKAGVNS